MRQLLRILGLGLLSLASFETIIAIVDWSARWEWFNQLMLNHPQLALFIRTPFSYVVLIVVGFVFLFAERRLKAPKIAGRITGLEGLPDGATTPLKILLIEEEKGPGWNEHSINWHWFAKLDFANESEIPTTIDSVRVTMKWGWKRKGFITKCTDDFGDYVFAGRNKEGWPRDDEIPNLLRNLRGIPLTHGIGHDGWVRFNVPTMTRKDIESAKLDFWIIDAMQGKHKLRANDVDIVRVTITQRISR